jgi:hypothetical protein
MNGILFLLLATLWLVPDVLRRTLRASRSGHDIAGSGLQTELPLEELLRPAALHAGLLAMGRWTCVRLRKRSQSDLRPTEEQA